ncbi:MAG: DMT family transporter [Holophagales bacterium]|nr:DMT family transporter [Holophagales bacterium]
MAHLVLALTVLTWSFSFMAAVRLRQDLGLTEALAARFVPVLLGAGVFLLLRKKIRVPREAWPKVIAMGLLSVPAYNVFFFHGMKTVPSGTAALIIALNPVFTAILARVVLGEPFGRRRVGGLLLALAGLFVVVRFGTDKAVDWPYLTSALLLALAPLSWALYTVVGRTLPAGADPLDVVCAPLRRKPAAPRLRAPLDVEDASLEPRGARRGALPRGSLHAPGVGLVPLGAETAPGRRGRLVRLSQSSPREPLGVDLRGDDLAGTLPPRCRDSPRRRRAHRPSRV